MTRYRYRWECGDCQSFGRWRSSVEEARRDFWTEHRHGFKCLMENTGILKQDLTMDDQEGRDE